MAEIRRTRTADPEMDAISILNQALAPLDRSAAKRVLRWAEERYVHLDPVLSNGDLSGVTKFMGALVETAETLNVSPPSVILTAMGRVVDEIKAGSESTDGA
jgi:hypothetical protein